MSTIVVMQVDRAVYFVTDAGQYDPCDGALLSIRSKVYELPHGVAFAWRGAGGTWFDIIADRLRALGSFKAMVENIGPIMAWLSEEGAATSREATPAGGWNMEVYLAGWSEADDQAVCLTVSTLIEPFVPRLVAAFDMAPGVPGLTDVLGFELTGDTIDLIDPVGDGLKLIEAQRRTPQAGGFRVAGGRAELTRIDQAGTVRYLLRDWGDPIGVPVNPDAEGPPVFPRAA